MRTEKVHNQVCRISAVLWAGALLCALSVQGFDVKNLKLGKFKARSPRSETADGWEIEGNEAVMNGSLVCLDSAKLKLILADGKTAVVTVPACRFDDRDKTLRSSEKIFLNHPSFSLEGVGCTVFTSEQRIIIHSDVQIVLKGTATGGRGIFGRRAAAESPVHEPVGEKIKTK